MTLTETVHVSATVETGTVRGPESWSGFYWLAALLIGVEAAVILIIPIHWLARIAVFLGVALITGTAVLNDGPTQNLIVKVRSYLEGKAR